MTELCELAKKYGTDKCQPGHSYTEYYYELFKDIRHSTKKFLEFGIGTPEVMNHINGYRTGASLRMWREFFPNAEIHGVDILPESLFQEERIKTHLCDERVQKDVVDLIDKIGRDIDVIIDDASHIYRNQYWLCMFIMPLIKSDTLYIIEDVQRTTKSKLAHRITRSGYDLIIPDLAVVPKTFNNNLMIIKRI